MIRKKAHAIFVLILSVFTFTSCFIKDDTDEETTNLWLQYLAQKEKEVIKRPAFETSMDGKTLTIGFAPENDMKYANVMREYSNSEKFTEVLGVTNVGQVIPQTEDLPGTFLFEDPYTSTSYWYRYYIRFYNGHEYITSEKTEIKRGLNKGNVSPGIVTDNINVKYVASEVKGDVFYTMNLQTEVELPEHFDTLYYVAEKTENQLKKPFKFGVATKSKDETPKSTEDDENSNSDYNIVVTDTKVDLQKSMTDDFFGQKVKFLGLIAVRTFPNTDSKYPYTRYYWSELKEVIINAHFIDVKEKSTDYEDFKETVVIPPLEKEENIFDYTSS